MSGTERRIYRTKHWYLRMQAGTRSNPISLAQGVELSPEEIERVERRQEATDAYLAGTLNEKPDFGE